MTVSFQPATDGDLPAIRALCGDNDWGFDEYDHGRWMVARAGDGLVGVIHLTDLDDGRYLDDVLVTSARRGAGIGADFVRDALRDRPPAAYLACHDERVAFYERLGFERVEEGELPEGVREHAYRKHDLPSRPDHVHHMMRRVS